MDEEPSNNEEFSELSQLDGSQQSDLGQENSEQGQEEEDEVEGEGEGEEEEQAGSGQRSLRSGNASGQEAQEQGEQQQGSYWSGEGDFPQEQMPPEAEKQSAPKKQKPPTERGQFYEMLYEIEHLIKIVEQEGNQDNKLVIVKWRNFAMSECTREPLSYIKQIDLMKDEVQKLEEEFEQTKFAPQSVVRVKAKIREYLDAYRKKVYPPAIVDSSLPVPAIEVGGMGPLNQENERRQITFQQLTRCQAAAFQSTRKKFQILFNDATEQDYCYFRSIFHDCYLRVKINRSRFRKFKDKKKNNINPNSKRRQNPKNNKDNIKRRMKVPKRKKLKELVNRKVDEVVCVKRHQEVFHYCIQKKKRIYTLTLQQMMERFPRTLPKFLRELLDLMEEVMHLEIDPDEHFINYRMTRFRESNRAKQIIDLNDKEEQPIYFGLDEEDVQENKRIDIEVQAAEAEEEAEGESMMDLEDWEEVQHQESEMRDQAEEAPLLSKEQEKEKKREMHVEMDMEMIDLNQRPASNRNSAVNAKSGTQMDIENEANQQNPNENEHQLQGQEDEMINLNEQGQDYANGDSLQSSYSSGVFDDDYQQMCQALSLYGIHFDPELQPLEQQEVQSQEQIVIDFNKIDLQQYRYYGQNDLIEPEHNPKFTKKELKILTQADKEALNLNKKKSPKEGQERNEDNQDQEQGGENSQAEEQILQQGMLQGAQEESDSESQPMSSDSEGPSDGIDSSKRDQKELKMLQKGILPQLAEDESLSGFSYSSSSVSYSQDPNAMDQELPPFGSTPPRPATNYEHRSFNRIRQQPQPSINPQQVIQISSDSSPLGRSLKRQKRY